MDLKIQGVSVHFPYKPYGCQLSMLNRVITALNNKQGCLIESPTGTGKTLALLCAALGWLEHQMLEGSKKVVQDDDLDDFMEGNVQKSLPVCTCGAADSRQIDENIRIPHIIYATRTHKQISQVIRELRKTKYSTINRNRRTAARCIRALNLNGPWDLEEYVEAMTKAHTCPYFFAFKLFERVPLCFCPYNYLLDPVFRETVESEISGSVIIIDEAHNIEDAARAATSVTLLEREVLTASEDLKRCFPLLQSTSDVLAGDVKALINLLSAIHQVMMLTRPRLVAAGSFASSAQVWSDTEIKGLLSTVGLGVDRFETVRRSFNRLNNMIQKEAAFNRDSSRLQSDSRFPNSATIRLFAYIFTMLKFLYSDDMYRIRNYRAVLMEVVNFERQPLGEDLDSSNVSINQWVSKARGA
ncbi:unnamed protein product, partial [Hydatigera taeniaeformis]|uniref:Helicase ATP-binding domain-containing protein n=1 Tax=Hydatigena taeniaeformis TaxID=6205 RepID=A0A0R3XBE2_HYDTA